MTSTEVVDSLTLVEVKPGVKFSKQCLTNILPDVETLLFFAKLYELDHHQVTNLLWTVHRTPLVEALTSGGHSEDLQSYCVDLYYQADLPEDGEITVDPDVEHGEILPEMWKALEVTIAQSIKEVAAKLESVVSAMPGKQGEMVFRSLMQMNKKRPTLGVHQAGIHHALQVENLVVFDVSGSMTENTVRAMCSDVVALSYQANAHLAVVSDTVTYWTPGSFTVDNVLEACEFSGTHYEELLPLFQSRDWGTVVCIADYDSSFDAKENLVANATSRIDTLLDVSLVNRPTFMSECLGHMAANIEPLLIGKSQYVLGSRYDY
jgi:hypothetical protein